jgi:predicted nucleotidyltransferase
MSRRDSTITQSNTRTQFTRAVRRRRASYKAVSARPRFRRVTRKQIDTVVQKIVQEFNPEKVILFGSYAYGKPTVDSDVDLLIIAESTERPAQRATRAYRVVHGKTFPMDIIVRTPHELAQRLAIGDSFIKEIIERGRVLYAR